MSRIVVLGSNSFSGSDFIDLLLDDPDNKILGISRSPEKSDLFLKYKKNLNARNLMTFSFDMNKDMDDIIQTLNEIKPDYIVNFAAQSEVSPSWDTPEDWIRTNVLSLSKLVNFLSRQSWLKKYLHISSPEIYGNCNGNESLPYNPTTPYAVSKAAADMMLGVYYKKYNFPLVTVRSSNVYGPHQQLHKIIPRSIIYMKLGIPLELHGGGSSVRSYIHIRDVSRGEKLILEKGNIGEIYHLSSRILVPIRSIVNLVAEKLNKPIKKSIKITEERSEQDSIYMLDYSKISNEMNWNPEILLSKGIDEVISWIDNNWEEIKNQPLNYIHKQ